MLLLFFTGEKAEEERFDPELPEYFSQTSKTVTEQRDRFSVGKNTTLQFNLIKKQTVNIRLCTLSGYSD